MTDITSKTLHEKTAQVLDRARRGERFRVLRDGKPDALVVPVNGAIDPEWSEILNDVRRLSKRQGAKKANPVLMERKRRNYASRLR